MDSLLSWRVLLVLVRRWTWVAAGAAIGATVALLLTVNLSRSYVASVNLVPKRARTEVNYDTRIRTLSSESAGQGQGQGAGQLATLSTERRQALAQLVSNPDVERAVQQELKEALPPSLRERGQLLGLVQGRLAPRSEIINISATAPTPALAEQIAAAWARAYERHVNQLYAPSSATTPELDSEVAEARRKYEAAETALTNFTAVSPLGEQSRLLERRQQQLTELTSGRQALVVDLYTMARRVELLLSQAEALQQHLAASQDNSAASTNQLALTLLKTQAFASSASPSAPSSAPPAAAAGSTTPSNSSLPAGLQFQLPPSAGTATLSQQRADVAATIFALQDWRGRLEQEIQSRSTGGSSTGVAQLFQEIAQVELEIRELQGKVAEQSARHKNLLTERDVAWESYTSLMKKAEETRVANALGAGNEVSLVNQVVVAQPQPTGRARTVAMATALGTLLAAAWVVLAPVARTLYQQAWTAVDAPASNGVAATARASGTGATTTYPSHVPLPTPAGDGMPTAVGGHPPHQGVRGTRSTAEPASR